MNYRMLSPITVSQLYNEYKAVLESSLKLNYIYKQLLRWYNKLLWGSLYNFQIRILWFLQAIYTGFKFIPLLKRHTLLLYILIQ